MTRPVPRLAPLLALILLVAGCDDPMVDQAKYEAYEKAELFPDGKTNQPPVPGTIARGQLDYFATLRQRPPLTRALVERGRERFDIFCVPCHGRTGDGDGMIVRRGFPSPPSYHTERLRNAPTEHFVQVVTNGYGVMYSYADRVPPADRWAIAAYIRALQLSQDFPVARLSDEARSRLEEAR